MAVLAGATLRKTMLNNQNPYISVRLCIHLITMMRIMAVYEMQRLPYMDVLFCGIVTREMKVTI